MCYVDAFKGYYFVVVICRFVGILLLFYVSEVCWRDSD